MGYIEKFEKLEKVSELYLKGFNYSQIARELGITPVHAKSLVDEYKEFIHDRAQEDPELLDRLVENTMEVLETISMIAKEAWDTYEQAKSYEMIQQRNASLKNLMDINEKKAKLLQLMGAKVDSGNTARLQRAEKVNEIVSSIIKEVISDCPKCRLEAQIKLAEAFRLMDRQEEMGEMVELEQPEPEIIIEEEDDTEGMLSDIFGDD